MLNLEYDKWDKLGVPPEHELTVPFTRMLAGPLDFHQGSFRTVAVAEFQPRNEAPLIMGTPCRTLASYVVFQNHLPMVADYPSAYRGHPACRCWRRSRRPGTIHRCHPVRLASRSWSPAGMEPSGGSVR